MSFPGVCIAMCITPWQNIVALHDPLSNGHRAFTVYYGGHNLAEFLIVTIKLRIKSILIFNGVAIFGT